ncbi:saccharopine dehydrogenase NADP-binding domain-containing protein [bacterium]|nr:saccharopine dehydrogenase NADP-binding domain-containing protein [bacterium]
MNTKYVYAIMGSGKQGTAEGYDLARFGNAAEIIMADREYHLAETAATRINDMTGQSIAKPVKLDASNENTVTGFLQNHNVTTCCGAAHYELNLPLTRASINAGSHFCDMGGNTGIVNQQHKLHSLAVKKGVTIIPDCGIAPGTANILAARAIKQMDCNSVNIVCGGLPQSRDLPLGYRIVFSVQGLTNEYTGNCVEIRNGRIVEMPAFTEKEELTLPEPVGRCEAFLTSGGTSTGPWSFHGKLDQYCYKTVRYCGHYDTIRSMIDMGLLSLKPVPVRGVPVVPRDLFHVIASKYWDFPSEPDLLVMQVRAKGFNTSGESVEIIQDLMDFQDPETGFTAMERTTAFSASIIAILMAQGEINAGVHPLELSIDPDLMVEELKKRGIKIETKVKILDQ